MDLVLVRHAQPSRVEGATGGADPQLTDLGNQQAKAMASWLAIESFDALYTSPMARARQTASPLEVALDLDAEVVDGVQEYDAASPNYIPLEDVQADKEAWREMLDYHRQMDLASFSADVTGSLERLIGRHRGQRIAVVCHGGVINVWAAAVLGLEPAMFFQPDYTSINRFVAASSGQRSIVSLNETGHLQKRSPS